MHIKMRIGHPIAASLKRLAGIAVLALGIPLPANAQQAYYIHADHLNTPRLIENQSQQVVWRWDNDDPFGANMANANPSGLGTFAFNLRLPGQYFDQETNYHYNYFRDYSPEIGRYIESDPIGLDGGINTYGYVNARPLSSIDAFGLFLTSVDAACAQDPSFCAELAGEMIENTSAITQGCVTEDASRAADSLRGIGTLAAIITVAGKIKEISASRSVDEMSRAAAAADRGGLTIAGRSLQKHSSRKGSAFAMAKGNASSLNQRGQDIVDDILTNPGSATITRNHARFGQVTEVRGPDGRGIRYGSDGRFIGFLEPKR